MTASAYIAKMATIACVAIALAGCQTAPPEVQTRIVEVVSAKPYRFITYTDKTDEATAMQIRRHNRSHQKVISAEKAAKAAGQ
jgi:starvation-inducible outer membrane lipoprotein